MQLLIRHIPGSGHQGHGNQLCELLYRLETWGKHISPNHKLQHNTQLSPTTQKRLAFAHSWSSDGTCNWILQPSSQFCLFLPIQKACPGISQSILGSPIFQCSCIVFKINPSLDKQFFKNKWAKSIFHLKTIYIYINPRKQTMRKGLTFEIPIWSYKSLQY